MKYRAKAGKILALNPDVSIVPECEDPEKLKFESGIEKPTGHLWYGRNRHKGLGIFSYNDFQIRECEWHNPDFRTIVPFLITNGRIEITLFAIWANNPDDPDFQYVGQVWKAIHHYRSHLQNPRTILIGDFNSNTIWDKPRREGNHSTVVHYLEQLGIHSVYHTHFSEDQGKESQPTFFLYRHRHRPYHIDYCFASSDMVKSLESVNVGHYDDWRDASDHMPVVVDFSDSDFTATI